MSKKALISRDLFSGRNGFILACIGSAVGMGNIWLFPRRVAAYGAPFLVAYLVFVILIGFTGVVGEIAFGRAMKAGPMGAFEKACEKRGLKKTLGSILALLPSITSFAMAIGYSVVVGWVLKYLLGSIDGSVWVNTEVGDFGGLFGMTASGFNNIIPHLIVLAISFFILVFGISKGIEQSNKVFMPVFFLLFIGIAVYVSTLSGAGAGYRYMFMMSDWGLLFSGEVWKYALGQAFFSLSLAGSGTLVYGSYLNDDTDVPFSAMSIALFDTLAAFIAALAIIPAVYAAGIDFNAEITSGPGLMFIYLPYVFKTMPLGSVVSIIFFLAVLFAGLSSLINLFECPIEALQNKLHFSRKWSVSIILGLGTLVAINITDIVSQWMDVCSIYLCPIGALFAAVMFFWVCGGTFAESEINKGSKKALGKYLVPMGKVLFCGLTIAVLILGVLTSGGIG